ncbi:MAG: HAD family hydrolase [Acidobacteriota bacterium]
MQREPRALLFDLDDTLYPLQQFLMSGFRAVAAHVHVTWGHDPSRALDLLIAAYGTDRGHEVDVLTDRMALPAGAAATLIGVIHTHPPAIGLSRPVLALLAALRQDWRVGVVTNGRADIQARKVEALGLRSLVDTVVLASEHGTGLGKPEPAPFLAACRALGVTPAQTVFVGDDLRCDIAGAHAVGMKTIWLPAVIKARPDPAQALADLILPSLDGVPTAAGQLLESRWSSHVA